jgi:hypothetical protein
MDTVLFTLGGFITVVFIMSIGIILKRKPIAGSCGGIANLMGDCEICEKKSDCVDKVQRLSDQCLPEDCH